MQDAKEAYTAQVKALKKYMDEYAQLTIQAQTGSKQEQLVAKMKLHNLKQEMGSYEELAQKILEYEAMSQNSIDMVMDLSEKQKTLNVQLQATRDQLGKITGMKAKVGSFMKSVASTVGWTLLITAILTAITALIKWVSNLQTAAKKQRELNKAINEGANAISAKGIVALKELSERYKAVGDTAEAKKKFLVDFKDEIEETGLAIRNVSEADDAFVNNTPAYVNALKQRAKAQAIQSKAVELYQEYFDEIFEIEQDAEGLTFWQQMSLGMMRAEGAKGTEGWDNALIDENAKKAQKKIAEKTAELEATLDKLFDEVFDLEEKSAPYFTEIEDGAADAAKAAADAKAEELKQLKQYYDEALKLFMDARTRELQEVNDKYDEQIALAKKHNQDTTLLEQAKQREIDNIIKKYNDERLAKLQEDAEKQYEVIQKQIERIRMMNDTSNLREPQDQSHMTEYKQGFGKAFMAGSRFFYQSGSDVQNQYDAQIEYNNKLLELTRSRIEQENALLNQQLEIENLTADRKLEIQRTLRENEMALSDAALKNEADNIAAYKSLQEKKNQAVQSTLSVASDVFGAMATLAGEETKAGKAFAVTQAIIDTYASANSAYSAMAGIPYVGPALGIAAAAAAIASGIANVKNILSTKVSSDVNSVSISSGSVATPPALSTPPIEYTRNLLGNKETDELNKPMKVYVLESDITNAQNKVKVTENNASF